MANLTAYYQFDFNLLNTNWYVEKFESLYLNDDVFDPWEDNFTFFTKFEALKLYGTGFDYNGNTGIVRTGTVEAISEYFYDQDAFAWTHIYLLADIEIPSEEIYAIAQTASTDDDFALLQNLLSGDDMFNMSMFADIVRGYDGADTMYGRGGDDSLSGDNGADALFGGSGDDELLGGKGKDALHGGQDDDVLRGGDSKDVLEGGSGNDLLVGNRGSDTLSGGNDDDILVGGGGNDDLRGGKGDDALSGGRGKDVLFGGKGDDLLEGGSGDDILRGGAGEDVLLGGAGEDLFKFYTGDGVDTIMDFDNYFLGFDRIDLSGLDSVKGWQDLRKNHLSQDGDDVVIDGGDGDMLILVDTHVDGLVKHFFEF